MAEDNILVTPYFKTIAVQDMKETRLKGRPCFRDEIFVEIRIAGDRNHAPCFPAMSMWKRIDGIEVTYAERWPEQFRKFKEGQHQTAVGTPLSELAFLTEAKRAELRALKIYTAEALAGLEGRNLKALGMEANKLKQQAKTYMENARGSADVVRMAEEMTALRQQIEELKAAGMMIVRPVEPEAPEGFETWEDGAIRDFIAEKTGKKPHGNPPREVLINMARELESEAA